MYVHISTCITRQLKAAKLKQNKMLLATVAFMRICVYVYKRTCATSQSCRLFFFTSLAALSCQLLIKCHFNSKSTLCPPLYRSPFTPTHFSILIIFTDILMFWLLLIEIKFVRYFLTLCAPSSVRKWIYGNFARLKAKIFIAVSFCNRNTWHVCK